MAYFGLRLLPFSKLPVALVALLPMTMMEMASLSPDALLLGGCVFFFGLVVGCSMKDHVSRRDIALLVLSAVVFLNAKPGYAILSLLLLLLLPRQFTSRLVYVATVLVRSPVSGSAALLFMRLAPKSDGLVTQFLGAHSDVNNGAQLHYVAGHPLAFLTAMGSTINSMGIFLVRQSVAAYAWRQLNIGDVAMLIALIALAAVLAVRQDVVYDLWRRSTILAIGAIYSNRHIARLVHGLQRGGAHQVSGLQGGISIRVSCSRSLA